jgi:hypothetical protein
MGTRKKKFFVFRTRSDALSEWKKSGKVLAGRKKNTARNRDNITQEKFFLLRGRFHKLGCDSFCFHYY